MIGAAWWQGILNALGWLLSHIYDGVHSYGLAIIILTLGIRLVLLPLGLKQIRSMQAMQALQPQIKSLQAKYKGNKQKLNEEMMKLYKERGVNPLAGCWPMLLQIPVLIALYSVLRFPQHPPHFPEGSNLRNRIDAAITVQHPQNPSPFLGMNLLCNAQQAGTHVKYQDTRATGNQPKEIALDCGHGVPVRIPYYVLGILMVGTMYFQQRQMQRAAPPGASQQQQALTRIMPLISIFWGFIVPSGVILYWTTSNAVQIGQQYFLLRAGKIGPRALAGDGAQGGDGRVKPSGPTTTQRSAPAGAKSVSRAPATARRGFFASMLERAEQERARKQGQAPRQAKAPPPKSDDAKPASGSSTSSKPSSSTSQQRSGGQGARSRKKRRKR